MGGCIFALCELTIRHYSLDSALLLLYSDSISTERGISMLGHRIRLLRCQKGLSQTELAHKLHVSASAVGMYEQGQREPSLDTIVLLTQEFEVTVDYLPTGHCICSQDIHHRSQVFHYMQKEIQGNVRTLFPDLVFPQELMVIVAALLLDETTG